MQSQFCPLTSPSCGWDWEKWLGKCNSVPFSFWYLPAENWVSMGEACDRQAISPKCLDEVSRSLVCICSVAQSCLTVCDPSDCSPPGSSVHGIVQARIQEWAAISSSRGSSPLKDWTGVSCSSCIGRWMLNQSHWESPI